MGWLFIPNGCRSLSPAVEVTVSTGRRHLHRPVVRPVIATTKTQFLTARAVAGHMVQQGSGAIMPSPPNRPALPKSQLPPSALANGKDTAWPRRNRWPN